MKNIFVLALLKLGRSATQSKQKIKNNGKEKSSEEEDDEKESKEVFEEARIVAKKDRYLLKGSGLFFVLISAILRGDMKLILKGTNLDLTPSIKTFVDTKLGGLEKYVKRFEAEGELELRVELARTTRHHRKGEVFMAEASLQLPGKLLRATEEDEDVRTAIDEVKEVLKLEIEKYKTKKDPKTKRVTK